MVRFLCALAASPVLAATITAPTCISDVSHTPIVKSCSISDTRGTAYSTLSEYIPDSGVLGRFGLTYYVRTSANAGSGIGIGLNDSFQAAVKADGPSRAGLVQVFSDISCMNSDTFCSTSAQFGDLPVTSVPTTVPVTLGDQYILTAGVTVTCASRDGATCHSQGQAFVMFQFLELDGTKVGFTDPPLANTSIPEPSTIYLLLSVAILYVLPTSIRARN